MLLDWHRPKSLKKDTYRVEYEISVYDCLEYNPDGVLWSEDPKVKAKN